MSGGFSKVSHAFWQGELAARIIEIEDAHVRAATHVVALYLISCPGMNSIGLYRKGIGEISDDTGQPYDMVAVCIRHLCRMDFIKYDERYRYVWVIDHARHRFTGTRGQTPRPGDKNCGFVKADLRGITGTSLKDEFISKYAGFLHLEQAPKEAENKDAVSITHTCGIDTGRVQSTEYREEELLPKTTVGERASGNGAVKKQSGGGFGNGTESSDLSDRAAFVVALSNRGEELFGRIPSREEVRSLGRLYDGMVEAWRQSPKKLTGFALHRLNEGHADVVERRKSVAMAYFLPNLRTGKPNQILRAYQEAASKRASAERFWRNPAPPDIWPEAISEESFENWRASAVEYARSQGDGLAEDALGKARPIGDGRAYVPHYLDLERIQRVSQGLEQYEWVTHHGEEIVDCKTAKKFADKLEREEQEKNNGSEMD